MQEIIQELRDGIIQELRAAPVGGLTVVPAHARMVALENIVQSIESIAGDRKFLER